MKKTFTFLLLIFFTLQLSAQWQQTEDNIILANHRVWSIKMADDYSIWAAATFDAFPPQNQVPKVHRSADGGQTWTSTAIPAGASTYAWDISPIDSMNAFVGLDTAGVFRTIDGGLSWDKVEAYPFQAFYVHFFNLNEGWVVGADNTPSARLVMSVTSDGGQTWINTGSNVGQPEGTSLPTNLNDFFPFTFSLNSSYDVHDNTIILGRSAGNYWRSDDKGYNWTSHDTPLSNQGLMTSNVAIKDISTFMVAGDVDAITFEGSPTLSFTTHDSGLTWSNPGNPEMTAAATRYIPDSDSIFVMVGHNDFGWGSEGTAISYDFGATWEKIDDTSLISIDFADKNHGVGACCNNIWATANGQISIWDFELPTSSHEVRKENNPITLAPNPAIETLNIQLTQPFTAEPLHLDIIGANGNIIKSLNHAYATSFDLDIKDLPKGFYVLKITGLNQIATQKFIKL